MPDITEAAVYAIRAHPIEFFDSITNKLSGISTEELTDVERMVMSQLFFVGLGASCDAIVKTSKGI